MSRWRPGGKRKKIAWGAAAAALVLAIPLYRYIAFNTWLYSDAKALAPYPAVLIQDGTPMALDPPPAAGNNAKRRIDQALVESNSKDRLVVHLSRSDIRFGLLGSRAYVKVFLETSIPGEPERIRQIKFLNTLEKQNDTWTLAPGGPQQLTLP